MIINRNIDIDTNPNIHRNLNNNMNINNTDSSNDNDYNNIKDDQARTMTPKEAINIGADYLVIGRPITQSRNPLEKLKLINKSIE